MPRRNPTVPNVPEPISDLVGATGMTQTEAADYLAARGVRCTIHTLKAWARGHYAPPVEALEALWTLILAIHDEYTTIPSEAPESAHRRKQVLTGMRIWFDERYPDPIDQPAQPEN